MPLVVVIVLEPELVEELSSYCNIGNMHHFVNKSDVVPRLLGGEYHANTFNVSPKTPFCSLCLNVRINQHLFILFLYK